MPSEKSNRARMKRERRKALVHQLFLVADILRESHRNNPREKDFFDSALNRAERIIFELKDRPRLNDEMRKKYAQAFFESVADSATIVEVDGHDLHLDGYFPFDELYNRLVVIDPKPVLQQVGGEDD